MTSAGVREWLARYLASVVGCSEAALAHADLHALGLDSLELERLLFALEERLGRTVDAQRVADCRSLDALVAMLTADDGSRLAGGNRHVFERFVNPVLGERLRWLDLDKEFVSARGAELWDAEGRRYLDFLAGYGALPFGHNPDELWAALREAQRLDLPNLVQPSALGPAGRLAERLAAFSPGALRYATFANSGAESVEVAIKIARAHTGRLGVLSTERGFHGKTLGALSATGNPDYQAPFGAPLPHFHRVPFGDAARLASELAMHRARYAAFIVEPIQGEGGVREAPAGYLAAAQALCREHGVCLIVDEVQSGLGRTGRLFACEEEGIEPDLLCLGKALGGGLVSISACLSTPAVYSESFGSKHSSTFAGSGLCAWLGLASLELLARDDAALLRHVRDTGSYLLEALRGVARQFPDLVVEVRGRGLLLGVELRRPSAERSLLGVAAEQGHYAALISSSMLNAYGVRVAPTLNGSDVLRFEPPLTVTREQCGQAVDALRGTLALARGHDTGALLASIRDRAPVRSAAEAPLRLRSSPSLRRFAFIAHPLGAADFADFDPSLQRLDATGLSRLAGAFANFGQPFCAERVIVESPAGTRAVGELILLPVTAEKLLAMPEAESNARVMAAIDRALEQRPDVIGLGAYTSIVTRRGSALPAGRALITTGNAYTVVAGLEVVDAALREQGRAWGDSTVLIAGATGSIGAALAALLAARAGRLILAGNPIRSEAVLYERLEGVARTAFGAVDLDALIAEGRLVLAPFSPQLSSFADVVFTATSAPGLLLDLRDSKPFSIVCDLSRPRNVPDAAAAARPDVQLIAGGLVKAPGSLDLGRLGLPRGQVYACMAETMMLALEAEPAAFSRTGSIAAAEVEYLRLLAERHGFRAAPLAPAKSHFPEAAGAAYVARSGTSD